MKPSEAIEKFFKKHRRMCAYYNFSGDRHCSCGRDEALKEIRRLQELEREKRDNVEKNRKYD